MNAHRSSLKAVGLALAAVASMSTSGLAGAQPLSGPPADPQLKYSTPMPPGVASPDKVETRFGTLNFFDGFPDKASAEKLYDNLDFQRAVQAYLLALPPVNQAANRNAIRELGPVNQTIPIFEQLVDSRSVFLTANDNTVYSWAWLDLSKEPLVVEVPPKVLGLVDDMWYRWAGDVGITGPDRGRGGKYLLLPPGYKGAVPATRHPLHPLRPRSRQARPQARPAPSLTAVCSPSLPVGSGCALAASLPAVLSSPRLQPRCGWTSYPLSLEEWRLCG